jgi:protein SCO1/2/putative membrane protein
LSSPPRRLRRYGPPRWLEAGLAVCALLVFACTPAGSGLSASAHSELSFGEVGDFELVERSGRKVTKADLAGRVWVCDFFFTRCNGPCPQMSTNMRELQDRLADTDVQLVSFSVEPEHDTPAVLTEYADLLEADPERWWFVTGEESVIYTALCRESFSLPVMKASGKDWVLGRQVAHSEKFIVVDGEGLIRGYYAGRDQAGNDLAVARARALDRELHRGERPRSRLPAVNATLNGLAAVFLVLGYIAIRGGHRERHALLMRVATLVSVAFLACYLYYHFVVTRETGPTRFRGDGWTRPAYLGLLLSHTVLAAVNLPLVLRTLWLAHKERWEAHKRIARLTFPIWSYVSVTGVLVYLVLYHWNPAG